MTTNDPTPRRYRFGPLERRGLVGSLRPPQVAILATGIVISVLVVRSAPTGAGVPIAIAVIAIATASCFWPIAGRPVEEWAPIASAHVLRRLRGRLAHRSSAPTAGVSVDRRGRPIPLVALPRAAGTLDILGWPVDGEDVGVVRDRRARTYTAALAVRVTSFGLLDRAEQEARQASWGAVLAGLA